MTVKRIGENGLSVYGKVGIESKSKSLSVWKIKIDQKQNACILGLMATGDEVQWGSKRAYYALCSKLIGTFIFASGSTSNRLDDVTINSGDVITLQLNLQDRKVIFGFHDKEYEVPLCSKISDQELKYHLVCRIGISKIGHQISIIDFSSNIIGD